MNMLNSLIVDGNVLQDKDICEINGVKTLDFSIGCIRYHEDVEGKISEKMSCFNIKCYGDLAEIMARKCKKGQGIRVVGRLESSTWVDGDDIERTSVYILAEYIEFRGPLKTEQKNETTEATF